MVAKKRSIWIILRIYIKSLNVFKGADLDVLSVVGCKSKFFHIYYTESVIVVSLILHYLLANRDLDIDSSGGSIFFIDKVKDNSNKSYIGWKSILENQSCQLS
jgi:hypothetical protein